MTELRITDFKTLWAVRTNSDLTEGRGREYIKHYCECHSTAIRLAKSQYVMGTNCPVEKQTLVKINGSNDWWGIVRVETPTEDDLEREKFFEIRDKAFKKARDLGLSMEEIDALREDHHDA